eukprot:c11078_g1_i1 orf=179-1912(+)
MEEFGKIVEAYRWRGDAFKEKQGHTVASLSASPAPATPCNGEDHAVRSTGSPHKKDNKEGLATPCDGEDFVACSTGSPHKKGDRGGSPSPSPSLLRTSRRQTKPRNVGHGVHRHKNQIETKSSVFDGNDDVGNLSFSPTWYRPGQKHPLAKKPRASLHNRSSRQLVFSIEDMGAKPDTDGGGKAKVKIKKETKKKRRRTEKKQSGSKVSSKQGCIEACNTPDFNGCRECEDGPKDFCSPDAAYSPGLVSQQSHPEPANTSVSRKRKGRSATPSNCATRHVLLNGKSPYFTHTKRTPHTNAVKKGKTTSSNMLVSNPEKKSAVVKMHTRSSKKEGSVFLDDVKVNGVRQPSGHLSESSALKDAGDQSAHPFKEAVVCVDSGVAPRKTTSKAKAKAKRSVYFTTTVKALGQRDIENKTWVPPISVHALIQEELYQDPWKVLVACMLLNKTSGTQMRRVIWDLFALCPTPDAAVAVETEKIEDVIRPLGLQRKRACMIQKFSKDYLGKEWVNVGELHGIGKYATDAYAIFCEGRWREVKPEDHKLNDYWQYLWATDGFGAFKDDRGKCDEVAALLSGAES